MVGIEIPARVRQALGLDDTPSWVIVSEHNIDEWPNAELSPLPGRPDTFSYLRQTSALKDTNSAMFSTERILVLSDKPR